MACLSPVVVTDRVLARFGHKGAKLVVPCGHCTECARLRRNEWFVRLWSVYNRYDALKLPVWFVTVTIDQDLWPNMKIDSSGVGSRISPFMRSWCERFRYLNGGVMPLRFLCSEFGSKGREYVDHNGNIRVTTGALHFHGLLFGKLDIRKLQFGLSQTHGHVDFDLIRGPECIRYVVKYATKDYSIEDPLMRARTFCSPGIGDPSFYFGDSLPTSEVLINGFHYRVPRYLKELQLFRVYSLSHFSDPFSRLSMRKARLAFLDPFGDSILANERGLKRLLLYRQLDRELDSICRLSDVRYREYRLNRFFRDNALPVFNESKLYSLVQQKLVGVNHPDIVRVRKFKSDICYFDFLLNDRSFSLDPLFINKPFSNYFYERNQTFLSLPFDVET